MNNIEFTLREFIVSGILVIAMMALGVVIAGGIHDRTTEENEEYFKALKVNSQELFDYALKTSVGNVLAEGTFKAIQPVSNKNVAGKHFYIQEIEEHYVKKTRSVSYKCGDRTCYRTETYWEWDECGRKSGHTKQFEFLGRTFNFEQVLFKNKSYHSTVDGGINVRFKYYTIPESFHGTLFSKAVNNDIKSTKLYSGQSINRVMKGKESGADDNVFAFWIVWLLVLIIGAFGFMALENRYLNGSN